MRLSKERSLKLEKGSTVGVTNKYRWFLCAIYLLSIVILCSIIGCGDSSSDVGGNAEYFEEPESLFPYGELSVTREAIVESNLAITSDNSSEPAVSVLNGGSLTLNDSTIVKTASEGSMPLGALSDLNQTSETYSNPSSENYAPPGSETGKVKTDAQPGEDPGPTGPARPTSSDQPIEDPGAVAAAGGEMHGGGGEFADEYDTPPAGKEGEDPGPLGPGGPTTPPQETQIASAENSAGVAVSKTSAIFVGGKGSGDLTNVSIETNLEEGDGLCVVGEGSSITLTKGKIAAEGISSRGLIASNGGTITINEVCIRSKMDSALVIDTGGTITLDKSSLFSENGSAVKIYDSTMTQEIKSEISMNGGEIISSEEPLFIIENTNAEIYLKDVELSGNTGVFLKVTTGNNDSEKIVGNDIRNVILNADNQVLLGDIILDENNSIDLSLTNKSKLIGAINHENKKARMDLAIEPSSSWEVTADSYLKKVDIQGVTGDKIKNIIGNGYNVFYDKVMNDDLDGKVYKLAKGGELRPE